MNKVLDFVSLRSETPRMAPLLTRRGFLGTAALLPLALRAEVTAQARITVGITVDTRPDWNGPQNFIRSIDEASDVGYHWIETFWEYVQRWENDPQGLKDELDRRRLRLETVSNGGRMRTNFVDPAQRAGVIEDHVRLINFINLFKCDHLKINIGGRHAPGDRMPAYRVMAETFNELGRRMTDMGMKFCVHPHLGSSLETQQDTDAIMDLTDPKHVYLVVDTGHTTMARMDPVQLTRRYWRRIVEYHIKDVAPEHRGGFKGELKQPYNTTVDNRIFFELGKGGVDFTAIKKILDDNAWTGWWTVELDRTGTTAKESAAIARKYLETVIGLTV
jgi:inosose dehydratase